MSGLAVAGLTIGLIVLSAFFVVIEFALLAARRHRLESESNTSASARAALRGMNELTLMLAGAQLGITACTFLLGAVTKPSMEYWLGPLLLQAGLPDWLSTAVAFGVSLFLITMLHLVVGEMAPKSWAIAHPERAAKIIGIAARAYLWPIRPFLRWVNSIANSLVRAVGVEPVDKAAAAGYDANTIRQLVHHSAELGVLEPKLTSQISEALRLSEITAGDITQHSTIPSFVPADATINQVQQVAQDSGHLRILVRDSQGNFTTMVHVRDTLTLPATTSITSVARPLLRVKPELAVYELLRRMRDAGVQLAVVDNPSSGQHVVTIKDVMRRVLSQNN
jgi:CBS domain containing-hemolysin-like protein